MRQCQIAGATWSVHSFTILRTLPCLSVVGRKVRVEAIQKSCWCFELGPANAFASKIVAFEGEWVTRCRKSEESDLPVQTISQATLAS